MYTAEIVDKIEEAVGDISPTGYRILVALPDVAATTKGGVALPQQLLEKEQLAACVGFVCKAGPDAYNDKNKFPSGPWCAEGDWIVFRSYSGNRIRSAVAGVELRLLNDDAVEAVIKSPDKYVRA